MSERSIQYGDRVTLHFTLSLKDSGRVAETTGGEAPATLTLGQGELAEGLERRLLGLKAGDRRSFEVPCMEAYGPVEEDRLHTLPRSDFPPELELSEGLVVGFETPGGEEIPGIVHEIGEKEVVVDFSHPLAGYDLVFDVEIIDIQRD